MKSNNTGNINIEQVCPPKRENCTAEMIKWLACCWLIQRSSINWNVKESIEKQECGIADYQWNLLLKTIFEHLKEAAQNFENSGIVKQFGKGQDNKHNSELMNILIYDCVMEEVIVVEIIQENTVKEDCLEKVDYISGRIMTEPINTDFDNFNDKVYCPCKSA